MRRQVLFLIVCVVWIAGACQADRVVLINGTEVLGTVTRVIIGESIELLCVNREEGEAQLNTFPLWRVASIDIEDVSRGPFNLLLKSGDQVSGTLLGSPLDATIKVQTADGTVLSFKSEVVDEVRRGVQIGSIEEPVYMSSSGADTALAPAFGLGFSFSAKGVGISRDAIAWFNEDWMLLAALGMHWMWSGSSPLGIGVSSDLTYLRKLGGFYIGIGTGVFFNMTEVAWFPTINIRVLIPFSWEEWQTTLSVGFTFRVQNH